MKRTILILISFICVITVIIFGNSINEYLNRDKIKILYDSEGVYRQYGMWEEEQLKTHPNYDSLGILIDIDKKLLYLIDMKEDKLIKKYVVATGKFSTPTPTGSFKIIQKAKWGGGFGSRWMKLNVPWGKYGIHGTNKPNSIGYNASHGCIRMRNKDIEELYGLVKYNTPVAIFKGTFGPFGHGFRVLKPGHRGEDVQEVQRALKEKGYYHGSIDGIYGDGMKMSLIKFLKDNDMRITDKIGFHIYEKLGIILME